MVSWQGWTENFGDFFLVFIAFASAINAIATGALIDMHNMKLTTKNLRILLV